MTTPAEGIRTPEDQELLDAQDAARGTQGEATQVILNPSSERPDAGQGMPEDRAQLDARDAAPDTQGEATQVILDPSSERPDVGQPTPEDQAQLDAQDAAPDTQGEATQVILDPSSERPEVGQRTPEDQALLDAEDAALGTQGQATQVIQNPLPPLESRESAAPSLKPGIVGVPLFMPRTVLKIGGAVLAAAGLATGTYYAVTRPIAERILLTCTHVTPEPNKSAFTCEVKGSPGSPLNAGREKIEYIKAEDQPPAPMITANIVVTVPGGKTYRTEAPVTYDEDKDGNTLIGVPFVEVSE